MSQSAPPALSEDLVERVLTRLGFSQAPGLTFPDLSALYGAWCQRVPFDNVRKLIHLHAGHAGPFPGDTAEDFFGAWLEYGTGGTCWSNANACHALFSSLGFEAERGVATMMAAPDLPPNHGTVRIRLEDVWYLVDCSMLHGQPLRLDETTETCVRHPAWGVDCAPCGSRWQVRWRALQQTDGFICRLESFGASLQDYRERYERTRIWSPFNYEVTARLNRGDCVEGLAFGQAITLSADGVVHQNPVEQAGRVRFLVQTIGISEEIVSQLPPDKPTPPPPWSRTAGLA